MNAFDLLDAMGELDGRLVADAQCHREEAPGRPRSRVKFFLLVAALAMMLMGCAVVGLTLQDLKMGQHEGYAEPGETVKMWDEISLQGVEGSPEFMASQEWNQFRNGYDQDRTIWKSSLFHRYEAPAEYEAFQCYSQEMIDKLDEICKKYKLELPGRAWPYIMNPEHIFKAVGIRDIRAEGTAAEIDLGYGYCYANGTFTLRGGAKFPGQEVGDMLAISCVRKGSFHTGTDSVSNIQEFDQWLYTMKDGTEVLLANVREEVVMVADLKDFFITVRLYGEGCQNAQGQEARRKAAEEMAECFDFSIAPNNADATVLDAAQEEWDAMEAEGEKRTDEMYVHPDYKTLFKNDPSYQEFEQTYALTDLNGDGIDEMIIKLNDGEMEVILTSDGTSTSAMTVIRRLKEVLTAEKMSEWYIAQDNTLVSYGTCGDCKEYTFYKLENGTHKQFDFIEYHAEDPGHWGCSQDGDKTSETTITEAEAKAIIDAYAPKDLEYKPISEFPMD